MALESQILASLFQVKVIFYFKHLQVSFFDIYRYQSNLEVYLMYSNSVV